MKELVDIHVVLATPEDMELFEEEEVEEAVDQFNSLLHLLYDKANDDIEVDVLNNMIQQVWDTWRENLDLLNLEPEELIDWVDQLLATWDDGEKEHQIP